MDRFETNDGTDVIRAVDNEDTCISIATKHIGDRWDEVSWVSLELDDVRSLWGWLGEWLDANGR